MANDLNRKLFDELILIMLKKGYLIERDGNIVTTAKRPPANEPFTRRIWEVIDELTRQER